MSIYNISVGDSIVPKKKDEVILFYKDKPGKIPPKDLPDKWKVKEIVPGEKNHTYYKFEDGLVERDIRLKGTFGEFDIEKSENHE